MPPLPSGTVVLPDLSTLAPASSQMKGAAPSSPTRLVRIYSGGGYFDPALAEKLRPMLIKALAANSDHTSTPSSSVSHEVMAIPPTKAENPVKPILGGNL